MRPHSVPPTPETSQPIYWFALLERALDEGNLQAAARAQKELIKLGVTVVYELRRQAGTREVPHAG
jgi:hypothetical protein